MRYYVAEIVAAGIAFLCALTNHAGACWVWRRLMPLDRWATDVMQDQGVDQRHRFTVPPVTIAADCYCRVRETNSASGASYTYCPKHGMRLDV